MNQKEPAKIFKSLAILLLCFPFPLRAATSDDFIQGYASAVLEREFRIKNFALNVAGEAVRLAAGDLAGADHDEVIAALSSIQGVKKVEIIDSRGVVVASSRPQEPGTPGPSRPQPVKPDYELGFLPGGNLFEPLVADPRWPRFSMGYRYFTDEATNVASATFGETIALYRDRGPSGALGEIGFQAGVFSIFDLSAPSSDLVNTDFFAALQGTYRMNDLSTMFRIFHQSSHLGDEFLLRNRIDRVNLSFEGVDLKLSYRFFDWLRLYGGGAYMFDLDPPGIKPWATQAGIELQTPWRFWGHSTRFVTALDLQNRQENRWSTEISVRGGLQFERPRNFMRKISLLFEYYKGHSPNGQFFNEKIEYFGPGLYLDF
ncbi:MAG: DUF1207 domain-containing protein [Candidatus Binatia bacterium]